MTTEATPRGRHRDGAGASGAPQRGRPRSEKARTAILEAAAELLLARGLSAVSMDAVAERAGVSKATIYRWWPTKETLALDALYTSGPAAAPARDTGSLRGDLLSLLRPWARLASSRPVRPGDRRAAHRGPDRPRVRRGVPAHGSSSRAASRPARSSAARSSAARSRPTPRSRSRSTCSTARSTTACCTATRRSTTGSSAMSSTWRSAASSRAAPCRRAGRAPHPVS